MNKRKTAVVAVIVLLLVAAVYFFYIMPSKQGENIESETAEESQSELGSEPEEEIEPIDVDLADSDALVRKLVGGISSNPTLARWLTNEFLIRKFVTAVDLISKGDSPRRPLDFVEIVGDFRVIESGDRVSINPSSYERYDRFAGVVSSLDAKGCVTLYRQLQKPIRQAYDEMGYPDEDFDSTLRKAIMMLLETPVVSNEIYLDKDVMTYMMENPELEELNAAQKHLLRMGPDNMKAIQAKLTEISHYLGY